MGGKVLSGKTKFNEWIDKLHHFAGDLKLSLKRVFHDERWSKNRSVTSLGWSPHYPELLMSSYNQNESVPHDPDGVVLVWNSKFRKDTPEFIFHCQSSVMSATFAEFQPNLVIGGTYAGQIVLWDNRSQKRTPVQRSPLSSAAHTHPVYCIGVVGTTNAHNLIRLEVHYYIHYSNVLLLRLSS